MVVDGAASGLTAANPVLNTYSGSSPGGHAMVLTGYDDSVAGGSFRVMNSWGTRYGDGGFFWLSYAFWINGVKSPQAMVFTVNPADTAVYNA
jgi:C1A family cysteine protease